MSEKLRRIFKGADEPVYFIAEIGNNFNGSLDIAKASIDSAVACGADAVKFQTFKAEEFLADEDLSFTYEDAQGNQITESQYEMFKRLELKNEWHEYLDDYAKQKGVDFFSSAADREAVDLLISLNVPAIKMASEDLINVSLLNYIASKQYPTILSTGMADEIEIQNAIEIFEKYGNPQLVILHCVAHYPTPSEHVNLNRIAALREKFDYPIGYSDHSEGWEIPMISMGYGPKMIEKHFTLDNNLSGPDHKMAANPVVFKKMVDKVRWAESLEGKKSLNYQTIEEKPRIEFRRSIVANQFIAAGTTITEDKVAFKRPGDGLKPYQLKEVIGKKVKKNIDTNQKITFEDIE